ITGEHNLRRAPRSSAIGRAGKTGVALSKLAVCEEVAEEGSVWQAANRWIPIVARGIYNGSKVAPGGSFVGRSDRAYPPTFGQFIGRLRNVAVAGVKYT